MVRLVHPDLPSTGKCDVNKPSPGLLMDCRAWYPLLLHRRQKRDDVVADQVELVLPVRFSGMERNLRGWQSKNQPATAHINVRKLQDVAEECAIGDRIGGIDHGVCADDHGLESLFGKLLPVEAYLGSVRESQVNVAQPARLVGDVQADANRARTRKSIFGDRGSTQALVRQIVDAKHLRLV
jgi:hypothetical protein